ncbi:MULTISPECIES: DUF1636 domain-containing protein [Okeania]|uniref:DUF1636 domain-containing protein n=1 Tax=Okeania hirsuta TaxID=1458930 RepID=A0A3N6PB15_9CYAN|nr:MULTISPECIES: DUF1636 domain-containing protein [Okeania]NET14958.1 DUF1636 domain-containing protein [Okeania sp. SIO1H6]NES79590.1 DUF1636 domain-containing protein [Okeania sp. SIO1H4]NES93356.1 DUF1636 domain-containing protein [Okeania sp. SIO2B9]NET18713.1 DUF1636 domain-containing protein [Okeania sp. SIO1H5]NET79995.1 DUF1636 domain-containing protein [Okeania sp. SIO1F9]
MSTPQLLFVCTTCASVWKYGKRQGISGGEKLLDRLSQQYKNWHLRDRFTITPIECMSACSHSCAISFAAPGKHTYVFGDLPSQTEMLLEVSAAVLECASLYDAKSDGLLSWSERPEHLKKGVLARIPPLIHGDI